MSTLRFPASRPRNRAPTSVGCRILLSAALAASPAAVAAQNLPDMPSFEDVLSLESVGGVAISPDGSQVAYTVRTTDWDENGYDTEIWLAGDGEPFQLTRTADGSSTSPEWSPDGRWLAFTADRGNGRQVYLIDARGGEAFALTSVDDGITGFEWSPDGARMALAIREPESEYDEARKERYGAYSVEDA